MSDNSRISSDELFFKDLFAIIWKRKYWIIVFVALCSILIVIKMVKTDNIYESKAVLKSTSNDSKDSSALMSGVSNLASIAGITVGSQTSLSTYAMMQLVLSDDQFISEFVIKHKFQNKLFKNFEQYSQSEMYKNNSRYAIFKRVSGGLKISEDKKTGAISLAYRSTDREFAKKFVDALLVDLANKNKALQLKNIQTKIDNYKLEIYNTSDISLKNKLADVVSTLIQSKVMAQAQEYYGFDIIVKPTVAEKINKVGPSRAKNCILVFFASAIFAMTCALLFEAFFVKRKEII